MMNVSRRSFVKSTGLTAVSLIGSQVIWRKNALAIGLSSKQTINIEKGLATLPNFQGEFLLDTARVKKYADDFGHFVHKTPIGVLLPANANDVKLIAKYCFENKVKLTMRGTGGAAYGQTQLDAGIIIDSQSLKQISWFGDSKVEMQPGLIWKEVLDFTIQKKMTPIVMPDTIVTSVGGKSSVGGFGETSYNRGAIVDQIEEFDLVLPNGDLVTCNENSNSELFLSAMGSMGAMGFITRVVMKLMDAPEKVWSYQFKYLQSESSYLEDLKLIMEQEPNGAIGGHWVRSQDGTGFDYVVDVTQWSSEKPSWLSKLSKSPVKPDPKVWSFFEYSNRNTAGWIDVVNKGLDKLPHPYLSFYVPMSKAESLVRSILTTSRFNLGAGRIMYSPFQSKSFKRPFFSLPNEEMGLHFRIYRIVRNGEGGADHLAMLKCNEEELVPLIQSCGGKVYLPFSPLLNSSQIESHFAPQALSALRSIKEKVDPAILVNSGSGLF